MLRNSDRLNHTMARNSLRQLVRIELLRRLLAVKTNSNPLVPQVKVTFNSLSRHKLLQTLPGVRLPVKNQTSTPVKIFEAFNSLQKFYNRRYKKYNFTHSFKVTEKTVNTFSPTKYTIYPNLHSQTRLPSTQSRF